MSYTTLLFDLDDTLLDFKANEADSLNKLFSQNGYALSPELLSIYNTVNGELWRDYEHGSIKLKDVLNTRFSETMLRYGEAVDGINWEGQYREFLSNGCQLMEGAAEVCKRLSISHRLFVITNGVAKTQIKRLKNSGLYSYFEAIFDSESIGFQKPSKEFFDYVAAHIRDFKKETSLIIGDSLNTDIKGGRDYGINTCWLNTDSKRHTSPQLSTYTINKLIELIDKDFLSYN